MPFVKEKARNQIGGPLPLLNQFLKGFEFGLLVHVRICEESTDPLGQLKTDTWSNFDKNDLLFPLFGPRKTYEDAVECVNAVDWAMWQFSIRPHEPAESP